MPRDKSSQATAILAYHSYRVHSFGVILEPRYIFRAGALDQ